MIWHCGDIYELNKTGTDETGKPVCELTKSGYAYFRTLPIQPVIYTDSGNQHERIERVFFCAKPAGEFAGVVSVTICGVDYTVDHVSEYPRGCAVHVWKTR